MLRYRIRVFQNLKPLQINIAVTQQLCERRITFWRASSVANIERSKRDGEFRDDIDVQLLVDVFVASLYYRMLLYGYGG
jgi:hypothetical protein